MDLDKQLLVEKAYAIESANRFTTYRRIGEMFKKDRKMWDDYVKYYCSADMIKWDKEVNSILKTTTQHKLRDIRVLKEFEAYPPGKKKLIKKAYNLEKTNSRRYNRLIHKMIGYDFEMFEAYIELGAYALMKTIST